MKRLTVLLVFVLLMSGCGANGLNEQAKQTNGNEQSKEIEVDKGLLNVKITLPASLFKDGDIDATIASAKEEGIKDAIKNEDGSVTYVMSKAMHEKKMKEMEEAINETITEIKSGKDFKSIKNVEHNDAYTEFTFMIDKASFQNSFDGFATIGVGVSAMMYQVFNGTPADKNKVTFNLKDEATGEVFDTVVYPDAFQ